MTEAGGETCTEGGEFGCFLPVKAEGLCAKHLLAWKKREAIGRRRAKHRRKGSEFSEVKTGLALEDRLQAVLRERLAAVR